jgi:hypothetical protein
VSIIRQYRRDEDGTLQFREAWFEEFDGDALGEFVVNHGTVGHQSKTQQAKDVDAEAGAALMAAFAEQCAEDGFAEIPAGEQHWVIAQYALKSAAGTGRDNYLRDQAVEAITGHLAWRGLGTVESTDFAPGRLNIRILSPEPAKAVSAIKTCIREAKLDYTKLSIAVGAPGDVENLKQKHPMPPTGRFTLA